MEMVLLTALGVGGATVFGSLMGFLFKNISHKFSDIVLSFAAGVMLAAAVLGLILPSLEYGGDLAIVITIVGKIMAPKKKAAPVVQAAAEAPKADIPAAPGTAGELKLYDTPERDAAMIMAIVANQLNKPLNELRFISIKEVK